MKTMKNNETMELEIVEFVNGIKDTNLEYRGKYNDDILFATKANSNVDEAIASDIDIDDAHVMGFMIRNRFPVKTEIEIMDEWVFLYVTIL